MKKRPRAAAQHEQAEQVMAEAGRVMAEAGRVMAEAGRVMAEAKLIRDAADHLAGPTVADRWDRDPLRPNPGPRKPGSQCSGRDN
jgi:hypothetical protein